MKTCMLVRGETLLMGSKWFLSATNRNRAFHSTSDSWSHLLKSNDTFMKCMFNTTHPTTTAAITTDHIPLRNFTLNEMFKQESNQFGSNTTGRRSALSGWLHLQGTEDSAPFLCSPAFCLLEVEEGEVEHSHDTTFVTFHTAFLQQGASPLQQQTKPSHEVPSKSNYLNPTMQS